MKKFLLTIPLFVMYSAILIKLMVFKDVPIFRIGRVMLNFGGTDASHPANFVPFKTILPYLLGNKGLIIAGINLVGNIGLLVPLGFLIPLVYQKITWKTCIALGALSGFFIEILQVVLRVGIFDIDDVILNALGVIVGYFLYKVLENWVGSSVPRFAFASATVTAMVMATTGFYFVATHNDSQPQQHTGLVAGVSQLEKVEQEEEQTEKEDLCGGTGGNGQITSLGENTFDIKRKDNREQSIHLAEEIIIKTSNGSASVSDLNIGDKVTLVGGPNSDGSFTADVVLVCN